MKVEFTENEFKNNKNICVGGQNMKKERISGIKQLSNYNSKWDGGQITRGDMISFHLLLSGGKEGDVINLDNRNLIIKNNGDWVEYYDINNMELVARFDETTGEYNDWCCEECDWIGTDKSFVRRLNNNK